MAHLRPSHPPLTPSFPPPPPPPDLTRVFNITQTTTTFRVAGACNVGTRSEGAYILRPNATAPTPAFIGTGSQDINIDFSAPFCLAFTGLVDEVGGSTVLYFFDNDGQVGFVSASRTGIVFELQGQTITYNFVEGDLTPVGGITAANFAQFQFCVTPASSRVDIYIQCRPEPAASGPFTRPSTNDVELISIFRPFNNPSALAFGVRMTVCLLLSCTGSSTA